MTSHLGAYFPAIPVKNDEAGLLLRHMAFNTVVRDLASHLSMAPHFMAVQAMFGECNRILLGRVNIVAGQTSHCRCLKAAAFLEQFDLAAVDVNRRIWVRLWQLEVLVQRFARNIGKSRQKRHAMSRVAPRTKIHLAVPRESRWIKDSRN